MLSDIGPAKRARRKAAAAITLTRLHRVRTPKEGAKKSEKRRHEEWIESTKSMVEDMRTQERMVAQGKKPPIRRIILGNMYPISTPVSLTSFQKAAVKKIPPGQDGFFEELRKIRSGAWLRPISRARLLATQEEARVVCQACAQIQRPGVA